MAAAAGLEQGSSPGERKAAIRKAMKGTLQAMPRETLEKLSASACGHLLALECMKHARGVCAYLSMPLELQTGELLAGLFRERYRAVGHCGAVAEAGGEARAVFVPKVTGGDRHDMVMLPIINGLEEVAAYPRSKWGIPEPELPTGLSSAELWELAVPLLDVVIVPGVAFDKGCRRLGRGKGYYDTFLQALSAARAACGLPPPVAIGTCLDEQLVPEVPVDTHDRVLDAVVTPSGAFGPLVEAPQPEGGEG